MIPMESLEVNNQNNNYNNIENIDDHQNINDSNFYYDKTSNKKVIGIKNVTLNAGSTTLTYLITKLLKNKSKKNVVAMEINKDDFKYYQDRSMISVYEDNVINTINNINAEIIIVDLNNCKNTGFCNEILYLVEPSIIKLNKLMMENRFAFRELQNKKIVLNKSLLSVNDVNALSKEAGTPIYFNIPPLNDRLDNNIIEQLVKQLDI